MQLGSSRHFQSKTFGLCLVVCLCAVPALANTVSVAIRDNVSNNKRSELVRSLRSITGWTTLDFDRDGYLKLGSDQVTKGSRLARELLTDAVTGSKFIVIEDASSRSDIAFCRVVPARVKKETEAETPAFVIFIDFNDFRHLSGDRAALASFDVGWGVLHELEHVVADSNDPEVVDTLGECEAHINNMRRELNLPLRTDYFFIESTFQSDPNFRSKFVRMGFQSQDARSAKPRQYWLVWDFRSVGGLVTNSQTAAIRRSPTK